MRRDWLVDIVARLPQGAMSRAWGWLARRRRPRLLVRLLQGTFARCVGIDMAEATHPMAHYDCLEALFVRYLKPGARPIDPAADAVVSPCDGLVGVSGEVEGGTLLQIKGRSYTLARLLDDAREAARYEGGAYATIYLAPRDYHRVHTPVAGEVAQACVIPGMLMPVFGESLEKTDELFARNERLVTYLDTPEHGRVAVVMVGATLVGRISVSYDATLVSNVADAPRRETAYSPAHPLTRGAELGAFELGSTVVLIAEAGQMALSDLRFGQRVLMGQRIGALTSAPAGPAARP